MMGFEEKRECKRTSILMQNNNDGERILKDQISDIVAEKLQNEMIKRKKLEEEIKYLKDFINNSLFEKISDLKDIKYDHKDFVYSALQQICQPLNRIKEFIQLIDNKKQSMEKKDILKYLNEISKVSDSIDEMVNGLLSQEF
jgi:signal transduction histidine kinase